MRSVMLLFVFMAGSVATHLIWILAPLRAVEDSYQAGYYWGAIAGTVTGMWMALIFGVITWWLVGRRSDDIDYD